MLEQILIVGVVFGAVVWVYLNVLKPFLEKRKAEKAAKLPEVMDVTEFIPAPKARPQVAQFVKAKEKFQDETEAIVALLTLNEHLEAVGAPQSDIDTALSLAPKLLVRKKPVAVN